MRYEIVTYSEIQVGDPVLDGQSVKSVARVVPATGPHHYLDRDHPLSGPVGSTVYLA